MKLFTVASEIEKAARLLASCERFGVRPVVLGVNEPYPHNGMKIKLVREALVGLDERVIVVDGYDVELVKPLAGLRIPDCPVFSAERNCHPDAELATLYPPAPSPYRFLNAGCYMGPSRALLAILRELDWESSPSDQRLLTRFFLDNPGRIVLDYHQRYFHSRYLAVTKKSYDCYFVHRNGGC